jgi:hypothetical protein
MAPPIRMPAMGTTDIPVSGTTVDSSTMASTGATPAAIGAAVFQPLRSGVTRLADVQTAITYISKTKAIVRATCWSTTTITADTTANWITARIAATTIRRLTPRRPANATTAASKTNTSSTMASAGPIVTAAPPPTTGLPADLSLRQR